MLLLVNAAWAISVFTADAAVIPLDGSVIASAAKGAMQDLHDDRFSFHSISWEDLVESNVILRFVCYKKKNTVVL